MLLWFDREEVEAEQEQITADNGGPRILSRQQNWYVDKSSVRERKQKFSALLAFVKR